MCIIRRSEPERGDEGFTLIELLVVIIIIGILTTIAIPVFLNQRAKAADTAAKSDIHHLAKFQEAYLSDSNRYGTIADIATIDDGFRPSKGVTISVVRYEAAFGYCISAQHNASAMTWFYDSASGGLQPRGSSSCPVTTTGTAGDSVTG